MSDELRVTTDGAVRIVTINRPDALNVISATLHHELLDVWRDLERDTGARCVILTGAGKTFSGGGDFAFLKAQHRSLEYRYSVSAQAADILNAMINFIIIAFAIFWMVKLVSKVYKSPPPAAAAPTPTESLLGEIRDLLKVKV